MIHDLINAFRQWLRTPVVTGVALLSLALGIGANVALFAIVDALLLKSLPVRRSGVTGPGHARRRAHSVPFLCPCHRPSGNTRATINRLPNRCSPWQPDA